MLAAFRVALRRAPAKTSPLQVGARALSAWANVPHGPPVSNRRLSRVQFVVLTGSGCKLRHAAAFSDSSRRGSFRPSSVRGPSAPCSETIDPTGITEAFKADPNPRKINLGVGAYRDDQGKPYVLPSVRKAEEAVVARQLDKEYAGITGVPAFTKAAAVLAYGDGSAPIHEDRVAITQSLSGTGALRIGGAFLQRFYPSSKTVYLPAPSWANHTAVFKDCGLRVENYRYYNQDTIGLDFDGMVADIRAMPKGSVVLLHACAHNPTGVDPTPGQWAVIAQAVKAGGHFPFFDMAYQGFASGNTNKDAHALRLFIQEGLRPMLAQSFAKNMVGFRWRHGGVSRR